MAAQKRQTYTINYKLDAVKFAVDNSLSKAAEHFRFVYVEFLNFEPLYHEFSISIRHFPKLP